MKIRLVAILAAGAAMLLASCASTARETGAPTLSVELFDWKPAPSPSSGEQAGSLKLSLPVLPAVISVVPRPTRKSSLLLVDAGLTVPAARGPWTIFPLAAPPVPAQAPAAAAGTALPKSGASAAARAATAAAPGKAAPAAPSTARVAEAAAAPAGSAAVNGPAGAVTTAAAAAPANGAPDKPYGRLREIYARQGDVLQVGLDGVGFLFLGLPDAKGQADGMSFKSKENRNNKTWFTFQALKLGTYDLDFLQQNNAAGTSARETVRVHVVSDQDFNVAVGPQSVSDSPAKPNEEIGDPAFAEKLSAAGSYQAAVVELLKGYKDGNPALNDRIAGLYMRMGSFDAAGKYYVKNLSPQNAYTPNATAGLFRIAVAQNDQQGLLSYLRQFLALKEASVEEPLIQAARMEKARSEIGMALDLAGEYVTRFPEGAWRDEADYLTAQMLEADSPFRDIARARDLYGAILSGHPESSFAEAARLRLQYIDRHFFQVR